MIRYSCLVLMESFMKRFIVFLVLFLLNHSISQAEASCPISDFTQLSGGINVIKPNCVIDTKSLMERRSGFAKGVYGGYASGKVYVVTNLEDNGAGTLRDALENGSSWIVFGVSGTISLERRLDVPSDVTVDGRGASIRLQNYGLYISQSENVIVTNIIIENGVADSRDAIGINNSNVIWVDHTTLRNFPDGLLDITRAHRNKTRVTASWNRFENHNKTMLIGLHKDTAESDRDIYVTLHHNYFAGTGQRHPRLSQGYVHMYNNVLLWRYLGAQSYDNGRLLMEANFLSTLDPSNLKATSYELNNSSIPSGYIRAPMSGVNSNVIVGNEAIVVLENGFVNIPSYHYVIDEPSKCIYYNVTLNAGHHLDAKSSLTDALKRPAIPNSPLNCAT